MNRLYVLLIAYVLCVLLVIGVIGFAGFKLGKYIQQNGVKSIITSIWEGESK